MNQAMDKPKENNAGEKEEKTGGNQADYVAIVAGLVALAALFAIIVSFAGFAPQNAGNPGQLNQNPEFNGITNSPASSLSASPAASLAASPDVSPVTSVAELTNIATSTANGKAMLAGNASMQTLFLNSTELAKMAAKYPVVYGGLGSDAERYGVYEIRFTSPDGGSGLLSLVGIGADGKPTSVLREFPMNNLSLG